MMLFICGNLMYAQKHAKKELKTTDYEKWHQLVINAVSSDGSWMCYTHHYTSNTDTLFIKNSTSLKYHAVPKAFNPAFLSKSKLVYQQPENKLTVFDLETKQSKVLEQVTEYKITKNNQYLVLINKQNDTTTLMVTDTNTGLKREITNLLYWKMDATHTKIAYITKEANIYKAGVLDLEKQLKQQIILKSTDALFELKWNTLGTMLAFISPKNEEKENNKRGTIYAYQTENQQLASLYLSQHDDLVPTHAIRESYKTQLQISEDGERVFFGLEEKSPRPASDPASVQIWNALDQSIYPEKIQLKDWRKRPIIAVWWPKTGQTRQITDNNLPFLQLDAKMQYAITSNPIAYEPQFKYTANRDYYITNLKTGSKKILLKDASGEISDMVATPEGKYILYFKNYAWWSYNFALEKHSLLTKGIKLVETESEDANTIHSQITRIAGCTKDDREVLIYDMFDIWKVKSDGTSTEKITNGCDTQTRYSLITEMQMQPRIYIYDGYQAARLDSGLPVYLKTVNNQTQQNGISLLHKNKVLQELVIKDKLIKDFALTKDQKKLIYIEQNFDVPPQVVIYNLSTKKEKIIHQSNPQHHQFHWGKPELFSFEVLGQSVGGILIYPANYNPNKKYPMIVHVYQRQTTDFHLYDVPSLKRSRGFNVAHFTAQGYFVCLPNMLYEIGNTGEVATKCINAAVQSTLKIKSIDQDRIGLIGHSYGGYETNFIVTQKNPFRTAVSGASYSDLAADFLRISWHFKVADYRRYEYGQMRMGKNLFEDPTRYQRNSPMLQAEGVAIPLLLWAGADDRHVDVEHSYKFHMALRRLQKNNVMLVYPHEQHVLQKPQNQIDLSQRITQWFDYYLKDGEYKPWMAPNYRAE